MRHPSRWLAGGLLALLAWATGPVRAADDFLDADDAFRFSVGVADERTLELRYEVAPGYYLYREQFGFTSQVLDHGRKIAEGAPRDLIARHLESDVVEVYGDGAPQVAQAHAALAERVESSGETVFFYLRQPRPLLDALAAHPGVRYLHRPANLEDLFIKLTGRAIRDDA
jgi:hypothetical protein